MDSINYGSRVWGFPRITESRTSCHLRISFPHNSMKISGILTCGWQLMRSGMSFLHNVSTSMMHLGCHVNIQFIIYYRIYAIGNNNRLVNKHRST